MTYPLLYFVDRQGRKLPEEDGYQHYRQYGEAWYVQVEGDWDGSVGLLRGSELEVVTLDKNSSNRWQTPSIGKGKNIREKIGKEIAGGSGLLTAVLLDSNFQRILTAHQARLWIEPGSLSQATLEEIIAEIGLLALSVGSLFSYRSNIYQGEQAGEELGQNILPGGPLLTTSKAVIDLYNLVRDLWAEIERRPLRSFRKEIIPIDITKKFNSSQALISRTLEPSKKRRIGMTSVESLDCSENQFLCYVLDVYLKDIASGLIKLITEFDIYLPSNNESIDLIPRQSKYAQISSFHQKARERATVLISQFARSKEQRLEIKQKLINCIQWSKENRYSSFLKDIATPDNLCLSSQRLIKSPTYGLILEACNKCIGGHSSGISQVIRLYRETLSLNVKATWNVYEIWCFVKIYSMLAMQLRLTPPVNAKNLFESIALSEEISLPANQEFKLQGRLGDGTEINISLWYDALQNTSTTDLRPDIKLKITINNQEKTYYLDAKYKNYQSQGVEEFIQDVIEIARDKYLDRLGATASFILHPDSKFDFWGEIPFDKFLESKSNEKRPNTETGFIGHKYGGITLIPGITSDEQINKLIRLIFQYHEKFYRTCPNCHIEADTQISKIPSRMSEKELEQRVIKTKDLGRWNSLGIYCSCQQCGEFWVVQQCYGGHHLLLKFANSFHKRSERPQYRNSWMYVCPECGSDPNLLGQYNDLVSGDEEIYF